MNSEHFEQGLRYIEDARFVRAIFIPTAMKEQRWNISVYEAHRATELFLRGMICLMGEKPRRSHDINEHVDHLNRLFCYEEIELSLAMIVYDKSQNCIGLVVGSGGVFVMKLIRGVYTMISTNVRARLLENRSTFRLLVSQSTIQVYQNDKLILQLTDSSLPGPLKQIEQTYTKPTDKEQMKILKESGRKLHERRDKAYYSEDKYNEDAAKEAVRQMEEVFEASEVFFVVRD